MVELCHIDKLHHFPLSGAKSGPSHSTESVSHLDSTSASGVLMASEDFTGHLSGDAAGAEEKPDAVESFKLEATEAGVNEPNPQNSLMEKEEEEEMEEDLDLRPQPDVDLGNSPEKDSPTDQGEEKEEENCVQGHCEQKAATELVKNEGKNSAEDTAQFSNELVIAKVEDFANEMAIDVDQTEDRDGKMEVDRPEDAGLCDNLLTFC